MIATSVDATATTADIVVVGAVAADATAATVAMVVLVFVVVVIKQPKHYVSETIARTKMSMMNEP